MSDRKDMVLIVDDQQANLKVLFVFLQNMQFDVRILESGEQALELLKHTLPDIILLDVMMPGMDGPTTLAEIREMTAYQHTPAIFMTAKIQSWEVKQYLNLGAVEVIGKPFDPMTLAARIKEIWSRITA